jgi:hypothetical protein
MIEIPTTFSIDLCIAGDAVKLVVPFGQQLILYTYVLAVVFYVHSTNRSQDGQGLKLPARKWHLVRLFLRESFEVISAKTASTSTY